MKEHRKGACPSCGRDHSKQPTLQKSGMSKKDHRDYITELCEELYQVGIIIKDKSDIKYSELDGKPEPAITLSEKFVKKLEEHYKIQEQIEYSDKLRGVDSKTDYQGMDRDSYIIGITIQDLCKIPTPDCQKCKNIIARYRGEKNATQIYIEHLKKEHHEIYKMKEKLNHHIYEWIILIKDMVELNNKKAREWRSNC